MNRYSKLWMNAKFSILLIFSSSLLAISCSIFRAKEIRELEKAEIFSISNDTNSIILDGVINSSALERFKTIASEHPTIKRIEIVNCDGSINDEINLKLSHFIYVNNYDIYLLENGLVASGGTDLFLAGKSRFKAINTRIGVHSWAGNKNTATDFPKGHKNHIPYINYYVSIGFTLKKAEEFYYFTINAAPADSIHWMTETEIKHFNLVTL